jgi:hypothetical protein
MRLEFKEVRSRLILGDQSPTSKYSKLGWINRLVRIGGSKVR